MIMKFSSIPILCSSLSLAFALSGEITTYTENDLGGGTCGFSKYTLPSGIYGTALAQLNWDNALHCGQCVSVTFKGKSITAMIVDECPGCNQNGLDLYSNAWTDLTGMYPGRVKVEWTYVDCPITTPLQLYNKDGSSQWWFAMQVVNANKAVRTLEVSTDGGSTWQSTTRQTYNFFVRQSGFGTSTVDVKVTSIDGDVVIVKSVAVSSDTIVTASSNFGSSGASKPISTAPSTFETSTKTSSATPTSYQHPQVYREVPASTSSATSTRDPYPQVFQEISAPTSSATPTSDPYPQVYQEEPASTSSATLTNDTSSQEIPASTFTTISVAAPRITVTSTVYVPC